MKNIIVLFAILVPGLIAAQDYKPSTDGWLVDLDEAYEISQKTGKPIMANFTGSDWCGWCKRLKAAVFVKPEFHSWAEENVVLLELDFPRRKSVPADIKKQNRELQQAFKIRGYPTVWLFDLAKDENEEYKIQAHGKTGYAPSVDQFTGKMDGFILKRNNSR